MESEESEETVAERRQRRAERTSRTADLLATACGERVASMHVLCAPEDREDREIISHHLETHAMSRRSSSALDLSVLCGPGPEALAKKSKSTLDLSTRSTLDLAALQAKLKTLQARTPRSSNTERCSNTEERASSRSERASRCSYTEARTPRCSNAERCSNSEEEPAAATAPTANANDGPFQGASPAHLPRLSLDLRGNRISKTSATGTALAALGVRANLSFQRRAYN